MSTHYTESSESLIREKYEKLDELASLYYELTDQIHNDGEIIFDGHYYNSMEDPLEFLLNGVLMIDTGLYLSIERTWLMYGKADDIYSLSNDLKLCILSEFFEKIELSED